MAGRKKHTDTVIAAKLAQADALATEGKIQSEIARTLDVSVMTLHRWRKRLLSAHVATPVTNEPIDSGPIDAREISELQLENSRLRRLVTDMLLERIRLEESLPNRRDETAARRGMEWMRERYRRKGKTPRF